MDMGLVIFFLVTLPFLLYGLLACASKIKREELEELEQENKKIIVVDKNGFLIN